MYVGIGQLAILVVVLGIIFMAMNLTLRKVFLYIFASVGLVLSIIGLVSLINLGLRTYVFTKADYPCYRPYLSEAPPKDVNGANLSQEEIDRRNAEAQQQCEEQKTSEKQRSAANAIAMLIVGVPLYAYHWNRIRQDKEI
jgi:hypothetical protein